MGVHLLGHLAGVEGHRAHFAADLADSVAFGDARYAEIRKLLTEQLPTRGITAPDLPDPAPFHADPPLELDLNGFGAVILTSGFRPDYARWIRFSALDAMGFPLTDNGGPGPVLLWRPLPTQAQVRSPVRRRRGRGHRGPDNRTQTVTAPLNTTERLNTVSGATCGYPPRFPNVTKPDPLLIVAPTNHRRTPQTWNLRVGHRGQRSRRPRTEGAWGR